jgi:predicted nucleic-acid-binding protein
MKIFDTNALLRYILRDNPQMADEVELEMSGKNCLIMVEIVAEMVYVLSEVFTFDKNLKKRL